MANKRSPDAYRKLVRLLIVFFVLTVICGGGFYLLDQSIKTQEADNAAAAQRENDRLIAQYQQDKAEEIAKAAAEEQAIPRPTPKAEGWDVLDLSDFPVTNTRTFSATRQDLISGGMLLVNRWHEVPYDLGNCPILGVHAEDKTIPTASSNVKMLAPAITALGEMLRGAKEDGMEHYNVAEGYRTREAQQQLFDAEAAKHAAKYSGDNLVAKVISEGVSAVGTSEYESGLAFRIDRYAKGDPIMDKKFYELPQSDWLVAHSWEYGIILRFPVQGYPNSTVTDKSYKTGQNAKLNIYRYVGKANAAVMHILDFCMEEYIEYLMVHPHIAVYQDGVLKYEITRTEDYAGGDATVNVSRAAQEISVSVDNMEGGGLGGLITAMSF